MQNKRIVHLSTVHSWQDPRLFDKQCISLNNHGYNVFLLTKDGTDSIERGVHVQKLKKQKQNRFHRMCFGAMNAWRQALSLNPDIIHFHDPELLPGAIRYLNSSCTLIYDIHEDNRTAIKQREYLPEWLKSIFSTIVHIFEKRVTKKTPHIIAEKYYADRFPEATAILNYPIIQDYSKNEERDFPSTKKLIYTGNIREDRGAIIYTRLARRYPQLDIQLIGKCLPVLKDQMEPIRLQQRSFMPFGYDSYVPYSTIKKFYREKDWLAGLAIFPNNPHFEKKQLTKFFEYMQYGIPIIYSDFPSWREFLEPLEVGIAVNPDDLHEIVEAIDRLASDDELWLRFSKNGPEHIKNQLNWDTQKEKLLDLYRSLLG